MNTLLKNILSLNCATTKYGKRPRKPGFFLAVIESIELRAISFKGYF